MSIVLGGWLAVTPGVAGAAGDAERGRVLAERWCASCHGMERPSVATDAAPPFATIAKGRSPEQLRAWLTDPHPPMPNPGLDRREVEDVIAYLQRLGQGR
jgi:mono/diheme cytochrome c family protein